LYSLNAIRNVYIGPESSESYVRRIISNAQNFADFRVFTSEFIAGR
jgi:hypothetical protein